MELFASTFPLLKFVRWLNDFTLAECEQNFEASVKEKASIYVPSIGKVTIAILIRNLVVRKCVIMHTAVVAHDLIAVGREPDEKPVSMTVCNTIYQPTDRSTSISGTSGQSRVLV